MNHGLNTLDIVFLVIIILSILLGVIKGLIRELFSLAFFVIAVVLSFLFYNEMGALLSKSIKNENLANFVGFLIIFTVVLITGSAVTYIIKKVFIIGPLKTVDRFFGGVFGLIRGILISAVILFGLVVFPVNNQWVAKSTLSPYIIGTISVFIGLLPDEVKAKLKYIRIDDRQKDNRTGGTV